MRLFRRERPDAWPSLLVTGGHGKIATALARRWPRERLVAYDLPDRDVLDAPALASAARGHDAIVHLAWDTDTEDYNTGTVAPVNLAMALGALEAACAAGVPRVLLASSVHADAWWPPGDEPLDPARTPVPTSPYGASKVAVEALARHFAAHRGLETVAIRFGGVRPDDAPSPEPEHRAVRLPHKDLVDLVRTVAVAPLGPSRNALVVGVGDHRDRVHAYGDGAIWPG
jgi:nucleoside-diphosphate-sugar epimerase